MPNTREKLHQVVMKALCKANIYPSIGKSTEIVNDLIANGVTVQEQNRDCHWATEQAYKNGKSDALKWIPITERLPEEHDSIWAKLYGTKSWQPGLFRKCSDTVLACAERTDGSRRCVAICTIDGKWDRHKLKDETVTHWMPLPEPPGRTNGK